MSSCIAAIFATMNRSRTAVSCVRALAEQTRPPELVIVADNASSDGTDTDLKSLRNLPFNLIVHPMGKNGGNAGGVQAAMEIAFARGADAVWILDDDSWPQTSALSALLEPGFNPEVVRHSLQIDPKTGRFTWPLWIHDGKHWNLEWCTEDLPEAPVISSKASWTGALISKTIRDRVGPVHGELFIRGEDEEYPWRIEQAGFSFEVVKASILDHPGAENLLHFQWLGKNFFFERDLADWKLYYKIRNMIWLKRKQSGIAKAALMTLCYGLATAWIDGAQRLPLVIEASSDGWRNKLGPRKTPHY